MQDRPLTRRGFLVLFAGLAAAACAPAAPAPTSAPAKAPDTKPTAAAQPAAPGKPAEAKPAASPAQAAPAAKVSGRPFVVVDGAEPNSLDPPVGTASAISHAMRACTEGLTAFNTKMEPVPHLATAWEPSPDLKTWTFKLRSGVKFHDGTLVDAEAVKFSIMRIQDPDVAATRRASYAPIAEVQTPSADTAIFQLKEPMPDLPALLAERSAFIVSPTAVQKAGNKEFARAPVGTGQFVFKEWQPRTRIELTPFADYWGPKPKVSGFVYRPIPEGASRVAVLKTGEADVVMRIPPEDLGALRADSNLNVAIQPSLTQVIGQWFTGKPPFGDPRVRKAASLAIDREAIVTSVLGGVAQVPRGPASPRLAGAPELDPIPYDPAQARKLLQEAGLGGGFSGDFIYIPGRWAKDDQVAEVVVNYLGQVGIKLTIKKVEQAEHNAMLAGDPDTNNSNIIMPVRSSPYLDIHLYRLYHSVAARANAAQRSGYANPEVDRLLEEGRKSADPAKRNPHYQQAAKLIWDDTALFWIVDLSTVVGSRKTATGWEYLPLEEIVVTNAEKA